MNKFAMRQAGAALACAVVAFTAVVPSTSLAAWPADKPIRMIVPYGAGGASDTLGRIVAARLSIALKQTVVVENKPGAGSMLGSQFVARAEPDGYVLLLGSISNVLNNFFYKEPLYDIRADLAPVARLVSVPNYLAVNPKLPVQSVAELIKMARAKPESISCATSGIGSSPYLSCELFKILSGTQIINVPFKSGAEAIQSVIGGQASVLFANEALPFITSKQLHALGVTTPQRSSYVPDVPAIAETLPGYDVTAWYGVWAPPKTPPAIIDRISLEINALLKSPEVLQTLTTLGAEPAGTDAAQFKQYVGEELDRWKVIIEQAKITPQ